MMGKQSTFHDFVALKLGVHREIAKRLVHMRLYNADPTQVASVIASITAIEEVKNACLDYLKGELA